MFSDTAIQQV